MLFSQKFPFIFEEWDEKTKTLLLKVHAFDFLAIRFPIKRMKNELFLMCVCLRFMLKMGKNIKQFKSRKEFLNGNRQFCAKVLCLHLRIFFFVSETFGLRLKKYEIKVHYKTSYFKYN